jgi:BirA family biotin operon repressor/biotin-[acetyl-CoA-carboxylase] ligase
MDKTELESLAEKVLEKIRSRPRQPFDRVKLARKYKVSAEDIAGAVGLLESWGYRIRADRTGAYIFEMAPDSYLSTEILHKLKTKTIGRMIHAYQSTRSTNTIANQLAVSGAPEGAIVVADQQTRGRGRLGRSWHSPEGVGLYCSILLRPRIHPRLAPGISLVAAVALADTISSYDKIEVKIKWPNDVLISRRKTAGILTELSAEIDRVNFIVVGIGVNINHRLSDFPDDLKPTATSVRIGLRKRVNRVEFLQRLLENFEKEYLSFKKSGLEKSIRKIRNYSSLINHEIQLKIGRKAITGKALDIDMDGRLVVRTAEGTKAFSAGEVTTH